MESCCCGCGQCITDDKTRRKLHSPKSSLVQTCWNAFISKLGVNTSDLPSASCQLPGVKLLTHNCQLQAELVIVTVPFRNAVCFIYNESSQSLYVAWGCEKSPPMLVVYQQLWSDENELVLPRTYISFYILLTISSDIGRTNPLPTETVSLYSFNYTLVTT